MTTSLINRAFLGCIVALATPVNAADRTPIIDMHLHSYTVREPYQQNLLLDFVSPSSSSALQVLTLAALEQHNIVLAVTDGHELQEYRQEAPGRILPGCGISGRDSVSTLRERLQSGECWVLTESRPQRRGIAIDAPRMEPYFSLAEDLDVPVGVHMGILPHEAVWRPTIP
ncbi:hypothetical protein [Microbulbifer guangxiensis]|uniref:hypothetical protein n=1 Tax=Microbulbifer guangxiensis TaxID=2904249 RepID=UPI001F1DBBA7|nr:hypothetical protein [Microbulbifer guangxiensis]